MPLRLDEHEHTEIERACMDPSKAFIYQAALYLERTGSEISCYMVLLKKHFSLLQTAYRG